MSDATHTPGPWRTNGQATIPVGRIVIEPDIAIVYSQPNRYGGEESKRRRANAHLIAAAPDLLAACRGLMDYLMDETGEVDCALVCESAANAIAKAEGRK